MATREMACMVPGCDMGEGVESPTSPTPTRSWSKQAQLGRPAPKKNV